MRYRCGLLFSIAFLSACGGGGGGGTGGGVVSPPTATPTVTPTNSPSTTNAQGTVIDDGTGLALANVKVQLDPWSAFSTAGPTPTPIATTTTDSNGHFTINAPNGTYLLVIGSDTAVTPPPSFTTPAPGVADTPLPVSIVATVHDKIVLNGQSTLAAPTMPPGPLYTPPATETSGKYRLTTLDPMNEVPCYLAFNFNRTSFGLSSAVADEWLVENARAILGQHVAPGFTVTTPAAGSLTTHAVSQVSGGASCNNAYVDQMFTNSSAIVYAKNPAGIWIGINFETYAGGNQAYGYAEYPIDARVTNDPIAWP